VVVHGLKLGGVDGNGCGKTIDLGNKSALERGNEGAGRPSGSREVLPGRRASLNRDGSVEAVVKRRFLRERRLVEKGLVIRVIRQAESVEAASDDAHASRRAKMRMQTRILLEAD
jgi:hypothetical protein